MGKNPRNVTLSAHKGTDSPFLRGYGLLEADRVKNEPDGPAWRKGQAKQQRESRRSPFACSPWISRTNIRQSSAAQTAPRLTQILPFGERDPWRSLLSLNYAYCITKRRFLLGRCGTLDVSGTAKRAVKGGSSQMLGKTEAAFKNAGQFDIISMIMITIIIKSVGFRTRMVIQRDIPLQ